MSIKLDSVEDNEMVEWWSYDTDTLYVCNVGHVFCKILYFIVLVMYNQSNFRKETLNGTEGMGASTYRMVSCS